MERLDLPLGLGGHDTYAIMVVWLIAFSYPDYFCPEYLHWSLGLIMAAMYIANMSQCKDFTTSLGTVKGTTLPSVDGIRFADDRKRQSGQQTVGDLAANMWIFLYDATAASLPNLGITRTHPFPVYSPTHPHRDDPSK
ncbi:hypothetical protein PAHAL_9G250900 [Panicum hallii]|uniref:Uncharacterized protein n=1 Tax=Panicum hallii TaxID=206008 RepID=A0A2T8I2I0_9POAL|nr:hypothetical protein PAHAL_9G250900 [Panicum hallii]PVH31872.1 hypothetical protein PAHAL_9G250900 [Panicum hallii]PVH31873.1 hypothetical protein PAHAL_9G250900 [Panicum hallii]PVH31877.1 hypothetical protein PAHAL_9G250900 [Panicum hallii]